MPSSLLIERSGKTVAESTRATIAEPTANPATASTGRRGRAMGSSLTGGAPVAPERTAPGTGRAVEVFLSLKAWVEAAKTGQKEYPVTDTDTTILPLLPLATGVVLPGMVVTMALETEEA